MEYISTSILKLPGKDALEERITRETVYNLKKTGKKPNARGDEEITLSNEILQETHLKFQIPNGNKRFEELPSFYD